MKKNYSLLLVTVLCLLIIIILGLPGDSVAQPSLPGNPEQTPIDGGLGILAAIGGGYAIKKLRKQK
ncbi:hypothetical protein G3569_00600 [Aliifodinibius halophilus]|uniref:Uncharacterized protein n=1 Tax=Fodinibius halophilus TaxID=1736908 RepID=A0A6M1T6E4_9BACT|nr:hypothetical protein [Fodinibius halophilus]